MNRVIEETNELDDSRQFVYDGGLLTRRVDRRGWVRQFEFDRFARNSGEIWYDDTSDADADQNRRNTFAFTYDRLGRMLSGEDAYAAYDYAYDGLGRPVQITQDIVGLDPQIVFTAEYDAASRRTQVAATIGATDDFVTDYTYDTAGRIDTIKQQSQQGGNAVAEKYVDFVFDVANRPSQLSRYADLAGTNLVAHTDYVFDEVGRLTGLTHAKGGTTFADYDLAYDLAGRMTAFDFTSLVGDSGDAAYSLDDTGQLTGSDYFGDWQDDEDYVYDENGNRITAGGATYVTGANNRLLSDGTYRYAYDEEGNRTLSFIDADQSGTLNAGDTDITQCMWDHRNRLTKVSQFADYTAYAAEEPDQVVEYAYDFGQRWVRKVLDANGNGTADASTIFVHDNGQIVLEFDRAGTGDAAAADLAHRYLWGSAIDQLLAQETVDDGSADDVLWALTDHLNSVRDLAQYDEGTDATTIARHIVYDAFGNVTSDTVPAVPSLFLYTARPFDVNTGLQNNLNRWYDAGVGRWLSEDPIGFAAADTNLYRYVDNRPSDATDPEGLYTFTWPGGRYATEGVLVRVEGNRATILSDLTGEEREYTITDFCPLTQAYIAAWQARGKAVRNIEVPIIDYLNKTAMKSSMVPHMMVIRGRNGEFRVNSLAASYQTGEFSAEAHIYGQPHWFGPLFNVAYRAGDSRDLLGIILAVRMRNHKGAPVQYGGVPTQAGGWTIVANYEKGGTLSPYWAHPKHGGARFEWPGTRSLSSRGTVGATDVFARFHVAMRSYRRPHARLRGGERFDFMAVVTCRQPTGKIGIADSAVWGYDVKQTGTSFDSLRLNVSKFEFNAAVRKVFEHTYRAFRAKYSASGAGL